MRFFYNVILNLCLFCGLLITPFFTDAVSLTDHTFKQADTNLWHLVPEQALVENISDTQLLEQTYQDHSTPVSTLLGHGGGALMRLPLQINGSGYWYVKLEANFADSGQAYWQDNQGEFRKIADFSQLGRQQPTLAKVPLLHNQAFRLVFSEASSGTLWIYINAQHYAVPAHITIMSENTFIQEQFFVNSFTVAAIAVMLTLALMALMLFVKTRHRVALYCAGYVGLHGIGWGFAAGFLQTLYPFTQTNTIYGGMYLFPFAIACASYFAYHLFNFEQVQSSIAKFLIIFARAALISGVVMWFVPFSLGFYLTHLLACIWISLSLYLGYRMLSADDFRAKYFFTGNVLYGLSLIYFMLSHFTSVDVGKPELIVLVALSVDCVCILLSLSEWLRLKQQDHQTVLQQARYDSLTKVGNRLLLNEKLENLDTDYLTVFIDCDGIKQLNDELGHAEGDIFLVYVAKLMKQKLAGIGYVYRTGGDEFIWICEVEQNTDLVNCKNLIEQLLHSINQQVIARWPKSGISYGIATNRESESVHHCLSLADSRMYEFKLQQKERIFK